MAVTIRGSGQVPIQIQSSYIDTTATYSGSSWNTVITVNITPSNSSNKILLLGNIFGTGTSNSGQPLIRILRNGSVQTGLDGVASGNRPATIGNIGRLGGDSGTVSGFSLLDSPASTSSVTYVIQVNADGATFFLNRTENDANQTYSARGISYLNALEIAYA